VAKEDFLELLKNPVIGVASMVSSGADHAWSTWPGI
jgi:hypothetical protein